MSNNPFELSDINKPNSTNPQCICFCIDKKTINENIAKHVMKLINEVSTVYTELITYDDKKVETEKKFFSLSQNITLSSSNNTEPSLMYDSLRRAILDFRKLKKSSQATNDTVPQKCTIIFISNGSHKGDEEQEIVDVVQQNQRFFDYLCIYTKDNTDEILEQAFEKNSIFNGTRNDNIENIIKKITEHLKVISASAAGTYEALSSINWEDYLKG